MTTNQTTEREIAEARWQQFCRENPEWIDECLDEVNGVPPLPPFKESIIWVAAGFFAGAVIAAIVALILTYLNTHCPL
jgi:hypothetical protein